MKGVEARVTEKYSSQQHIAKNTPTGREDSISRISMDFGTEWASFRAAMIIHGPCSAALVSAVATLSMSWMASHGFQDMQKSRFNPPRGPD